MLLVHKCGRELFAKPACSLIVSIGLEGKPRQVLDLSSCAIISVGCLEEVCCNHLLIAVFGHFHLLF
jgi:hypothetical protein